MDIFVFTRPFKPGMVEFCIIGIEGIVNPMMPGNAGLGRRWRGACVNPHNVDRLDREGSSRVCTRFVQGENPSRVCRGSVRPARCRAVCARHPTPLEFRKGYLVDGR